MIIKAANDDCDIILKQGQSGLFFYHFQSDIVFKPFCCKFSDMFALCEVWIMLSSLAHILL